MLAFALSIAAAVEAPLPAPTGPVTYELDPAKSRLYVLVRYDRSALVAGHDHVVAATDFDATATWDVADPSACDVRFAFPVSALAVDPGASRAWEGLAGTTSDGDKRAITENLGGKHQLHAALFPDVRFASTRCVADGDAVRVEGQLSLHGVAAPVAARMTVRADGSTFHATGRFTASHADWGFAPFTALLGSLRNDDALAFTVDVRGAAR